MYKLWWLGVIHWNINGETGHGSAIPYDTAVAWVEEMNTMTIHREMFDSEQKATPTMHRIYVEFEGGYFITTIDPMFNSHLQEMVADLGRPVKVEFRATDEGWIQDDLEEMIKGVRDDRG